MKSKLLVIAISALPVLGVSNSALAGSKHQSRYHHVYRSAPALAWSAPVAVAGPWAPARMIEARPGLWISSYDCVAEEAQGRWRPCSSLGGGGARP
jgi:hypothetical protein